ncbi:MAG: substrate-binding domain-containing protein [Pseudanabaenaceae cyanobacterium SKYGB_i_bin29]|nr:substrate-binding domain-containing protein [Pseudanabaenaceae cyanobacterium SKYG29]MDW8422062.1 substrate-binding domain-containing protein [Pseudanabaenaceae cyanobacterium SKYGB_i_bin29]
MRNVLTSLAIGGGSLLLAYAPLPGLQQTLIIVSGSELEEPLKVLEQTFEKQHPNIKIEVRIQGSQELVNRVVDKKNDFQPTILIPANGELLKELEQRVGGNAFYDPPQPVAKTLLVAVSWAERGQVLFPGGQFDWRSLHRAMSNGSWGAIGGNPRWGSFDFVTTDPTRSNSGQLTLALWAQSHLGRLDNASLNSPESQALFSLIKRSVYQPPRSTDILLQEFITRGPNDADIAMVYESIALHRWQQASQSQGKPYQIYYPNPTIETASTAAILREGVSPAQAEAARTFIRFLQQPPQQAVFAQYGFRSVANNFDLKSVANSPWAQNIPGVAVTIPGQVLPQPDRQILTEVIRQWERSN